MPEEFKLKSEDIMSSKKNRKKAIIISAVIAVVFVLSVLGYLGWKRYSDKQKNLQDLQVQIENLRKEAENLTNQVAKQENSVTEEASSQEETKTDEYSGWNTYTNSEIGYQLRYPADWKIKETDSTSEITGDDVKYITITTPDKKYFLYWGLREKNDNFAISDRTGMGAGDLIQEGSITILETNVAIKKLVYKSKVKEYFFPSAGSTKTADGKYYFGAALSPGAGSGTDYDDLNIQGIPELEKAKLILSSVKIIQRTTPAETSCLSTLTSTDKLAIKNWKTFKNDKYKYSFKYPEDWNYNKVSDKLINFTGPDNLVFSWRSEEMTALGYEGWETDNAPMNLKVACQSAKSTFLKQGDERLIFTQFKKDSKQHMTSFSYRYIGASISSDLVEMYNLVLKSVVFE